jgi:hypothetical protein
MDAFVSAFVSVTGAGAAGGALNALVTDNRRPWPSRVERGARRGLVLPGLVVNVAVGAGCSAAALWTFGGAGSTTSIGRAMLQMVVGMLIGSLGARWITNEADKRLLRAAACRAAAAPAADPETIRAMEVAPPRAVLKVATALEPRRATHR